MCGGGAGVGGHSPKMALIKELVEGSSGAGDKRVSGVHTSKVS